MKRLATIAVTSAAGLLAVGAGAAFLAEDPERAIDPVSLDGADLSSAFDASDEQEGAESTRSVDGLEEVVGELRSGEDVDDWYVSGVEVEFGPEEWLWTDPEVADLDGDGTVGPVPEELASLEGEEVTLGVRFDGDGDDEDDDREAEVYTVNGVEYRDAGGDDAPWQQNDDGGRADRADVQAAAEEAVGEGARAVEVDETTEDGWTGWEAEVLDSSGEEYEVVLDLSGEVVDVRADD